MIKKIFFLLFNQVYLSICKKLFSQMKRNYFLISHSFKKIKFVSIIYIYIIYILTPLNPAQANEFIDYLLIDRLVISCYKDIKSCDKALLKIYDYQKNAAINQKYSCQTRLLGLEANLIMATNFNFKRRQAKSIINSIRKYC